MSDERDNLREIERLRGVIASDNRIIRDHLKRNKELWDALSKLEAVCREEFEGEVTADELDNEPVSAGVNSVSPITFGVIREARRVLGIKAPWELKQKEPAQ